MQITLVGGPRNGEQLRVERSAMILKVPARKPGECQTSFQEREIAWYRREPDGGRYYRFDGWE